MTAQPTTPPPSPGPDLALGELGRLVALGRDRGTLSVEEVLVALGCPEPTPSFIEAITELLAGHGITVDLGDHEGEPGMPEEVVVAPKVAERRARPRDRRASSPPRAVGERQAPAGTGGASADPVELGAYQALARSTTFAKAVAGAEPGVADLLQRLAVEEVADTDAVLAQFNP